MNIQIVNDEKKPLLRRREITAKLGYENKTPSRLDVRKELAKKLNAKEELVVVRMIKPFYGTSAADLEVVIYDDEKAMKEIEAKYMVNRHLPPEKKESEKKVEAKEEKEIKKEEVTAGAEQAEKEPAAEKKEEKKEEKQEEKKEEK